MNKNKNQHTDITIPFWLKVLPEAGQRRILPYVQLMRLDRPIGTWLLFLPALASILLSTGGVAALELRTAVIILLFGIGSIIMRGAGCIINDLWDRDIDKKVERTASRPLASGAVSAQSAIIFLATLLFFALFILLQFDGLTIWLGIISMGFVGIYPLMKRITWWPQAFLGLTFNFGALMGASAVTGELGWHAILLYIGGIFWTLGYDTIYAAQDMEDDALVGVRSTVRLFEDDSLKMVCIFYGAAAALWAIALWAGSGFFSTILIALPAVHFVWQLRKWDWQDRAISLRLFKSNRDAGLLLCLACGCAAFLS